jgi:hypothetical protein
MAEIPTVAAYVVIVCSSPFAAARITVTTVRSCYFAVTSHLPDQRAFISER